jgi:hypothetical protein
LAVGVCGQRVCSEKTIEGWGRAQEYARSRKRVWCVEMGGGLCFFCDEKAPFCKGEGQERAGRPRAARAGGLGVCVAWRENEARGTNKHNVLGRTERRRPPQKAAGPPARPFLQSGRKQRPHYGAQGGGAGRRQDDDKEKKKQQRGGPPGQPGGFAFARTGGGGDARVFLPSQTRGGRHRPAKRGGEV